MADFKSELPTLKDLECLNHWPPGSVGEASESVLLRDLLDMCNTHGFGRISQVASQIEDIWRNPEGAEKYQMVKDEHLEMLETYVEGGS